MATAFHDDVRLDTLSRVGTAMADAVRRKILLQLLNGPSYPADLAAELGEGPLLDFYQYLDRKLTPLLGV